MRVLIAHASEVSRGKLADVVTRGRRFSLDILTTSNGPDTLDLLLGEDPPEVALVDWDLPGLEAPELCRLVRDFHHHHDTWLVVLAGRAHRESAGDVWKAGADDCVFTPAAARLLSDRVTKGLCEMAPAMREATAEATLPARAVADGGAAMSPFGGEDEASASRLEVGIRPSLDAVRRGDDEELDEQPASLAAELRATVDPDGLDDRAELAAAPFELAARRVDADERRGASRGPATLEAVLVRL